MIDNTHVGGRLIFDNFGISPKTTWQIDPVSAAGIVGSHLPSSFFLTHFFALPFPQIYYYFPF